VIWKRSSFEIAPVDAVGVGRVCIRQGAGAVD
jgi:hypothetical protein